MLIRTLVLEPMVQTVFLQALSPLLGLPHQRHYPGLAPWAAFLCRFAALQRIVWPKRSLRENGKKSRPSGQRTSF